MKTQAAVLRQLGGPLSVEEVEIPPLDEGQVLVRLKASGLCQTQLKEIRGKRGADPFLPHLIGHEGAGIVQAVGARVGKVKEGDCVVISWIKGEGLQSKPPKYSRNGEVINAGMANTLTGLSIVSENRVTRIPSSMPLDKAALFGCAVATGVGAVLNDGKAKAGNSVAVLGAGGIGLNAIQGARIAKAAPIIAIDIHEEKLKKALDFGATHSLNAKDPEIEKKILELTGGKGVDIAIESAGQVATMELGHRIVRRGGGKCILVGNLEFGKKIAIDPFELVCGRQIQGSWGGGTLPDRDFRAFTEYFRSGLLKLEELITHRYPLAQVNEAFDLLEKGEAGRILIEFP